MKALQSTVNLKLFPAPTEAETEELSRSAALLYGLIHARYIITSHGLEAMVRISEVKIGG
jgi:Casein kinase II regulatory subunit